MSSSLETFSIQIAAGPALPQNTGRITGERTFHRALRLRLRDHDWQARVDSKGTPCATYHIDDKPICPLTLTAESKTDNLSPRDRIWRYYVNQQKEAYIQQIEQTAVPDDKDNLLEAHTIRVVVAGPIKTINYWLVITDNTGLYAMVLAAHDKHWDTVEPLIKPVIASAHVLTTFSPKQDTLRLTSGQLTIPIRGNSWFTKWDEENAIVAYHLQHSDNPGIRLSPIMSGDGPLAEIANLVVFGEVDRQEIVSGPWPTDQNSAMIVATGHTSLDDSTPTQVTEMFRFFRVDPQHIICVSAWATTKNWMRFKPQAEAILNNATFEP